MATVPDEHHELKFIFDRATFESKLNFRIFELESGVWVSSPFSEIGETVRIRETADQRVLSCEGNVVNEQIRARHA